MYVWNIRLLKMTSALLNWYVDFDLRDASAGADPENPVLGVTGVKFGVFFG